MKLFCSGIGGIGLSAYAAQMHARGHEVRGSDHVASPLTHDLESQGIKIVLNQDGTGVMSDLDLFVYSEAIPFDAPERMKATELGIRQLSYFQAIGELSAGNEVICICGSHGKSTTTAMIAKVWIDAGLHPNVIVGTKMKELGGRNWRKGASNIWIIEACEYRQSFLHLSPTTIVVTTADVDHFDAFPSQREYDEAYKEFFLKLPSEGVLIGHASDADVVRIAASAGKTLLNADLEQKVELSVPGEHMRENAKLVLATAKAYGISLGRALQSLQSFEGTWRRMELKGKTSKGAVVIDDYGHHPVEIRATLQALREKYPTKKILCVFQPHMHNRTKALWDDFSKAFTVADHVILSDVYDARPDTEQGLVDIKQLAGSITKASKCKVTLGGSVTNTEVLVLTLHTAEDIVLVMGAGSITTIASNIVE